MKKIEITEDMANAAIGLADEKTKLVLETLFGIKKEIKPEPPKDIMDRIKTFEDADVYVKENIKLFPPLPMVPHGGSKYDWAHYKLIIIIMALNEGWKPNWIDSNEYKYLPWFEFKNNSGSSSGFGFANYDYGRWYTIALVGSRLVFKNRELAEYAAKQFQELYNDYLTY